MKDVPQQKQGGDSPSFYARHLHLTGIERSDACHEDLLRSDRAELAALVLPPLKFPASIARHARSPRFMDRLVNDYGGLIGMAAMALLVVLPMLTMRHTTEIQGPILTGESVRAKGIDSVTLYVERDGAVTRFEVGSALRNGDRLRTEVLAAADRTAYLFVSNAARQVLNPLNEIIEEKIAVRAGQKALFSGSFELVGPSEGEALNVLICPPQIGASLVSEFIKGFSGDVKITAPDGCILKAFGLR